MSKPAPRGQDRRQQGRKRLITAVASVAIAGVAVSSLSLYHHYSPSKTSFCDFGETFNCDIVNRSGYSTVLGIPVAVIGICGYVLMLALATIYRNKSETPLMLVIVSLAGLAFSLYLTYIEKFVLGVWCILCLTSLVLILSAAILSAAVARRARDEV
jgi:uncharacterized membrane protein